MCALKCISLARAITINNFGIRYMAAASSQPLLDYFTADNACGTGVATLDSGGYSAMTNGVIDGAVYSLISAEPMVYSA